MTGTDAAGPSRRALLRTGLVLLSAPAIVRAGSLMPIRVLRDLNLDSFPLSQFCTGLWTPRMITREIGVHLKQNMKFFSNYDIYDQ